MGGSYGTKPLRDCLNYGTAHGTSLLTGLLQTETGPRRVPDDSSGDEPDSYGTGALTGRGAYGTSRLRDEPGPYTTGGLLTALTGLVQLRDGGAYGTCLLTGLLRAEALTGRAGLLRDGGSYGTSPLRDSCNCGTEALTGRASLRDFYETEAGPRRLRDDPLRDEPDSYRTAAYGAGRLRDEPLTGRAGLMRDGGTEALVQLRDGGTEALTGRASLRDSYGPRPLRDEPDSYGTGVLTGRNYGTAYGTSLLTRLLRDRDGTEALTGRPGRRRAGDLRDGGAYGTVRLRDEPLTDEPDSYGRGAHGT
ncbi:unnamed protein product, partial [Symbiodinium sp. CCMP2456]